ncbi:MAG TPA: glycosyltransferase family 4 protein [Thermoanaerobaculia bacterium]|nr:glycosyltransferase family 4 protein [Thermoanaerobaculia bacterium]
MAERIAICGTKVPFVSGGAEVLIESLRGELVARGCEVDVVTIPFNWSSRERILKSALAWRLVDLTEVAGRRIDRVIATRFPSYLVKHPNKVVWLVHQMRQVYDLLGTPYSDFTGAPRDARTIAMLRAMDERTLREARCLYAISQNTAGRLKRYNGLDAQALYPPPKLGEAYRTGAFGDYLFAVGRLDPLKRFDLLIEALARTETPVRCRIAGTGPDREALLALAQRLGVAERVELLGFVDDDRLVELFAESLAVFYAPFDEDYGYVTVEAFRSGKPVLTASDAGGVLEFVEDGSTGFVCPPDAPREFAARMDELWRRRDLAARLGEAGRAKVAGIGWDAVISELLR